MTGHVCWLVRWLTSRSLERSGAINVAAARQALGQDVRKLCMMLLACELSKEKPRATWDIEADDGDEDFLCHTLFLKQVSYRIYHHCDGCRRKTGLSKRRRDDVTTRQAT